MSWELIWTRPVLHDLSRLDRRAAERLRNATRRFGETERGDPRKLEGSDDEWAPRVGEWRVRFVYNRERNAVMILRVLPQRDAYRR